MPDRSTDAMLLYGTSTWPSSTSGQVKIVLVRAYHVILQATIADVFVDASAITL